jgi:hypothetical protein
VIKLLKSFAWLFVLTLAGCDTYEQVPMNVTEKANELCSTMGGVKQLYVKSWSDNPKVSSSPMNTKLLVTCRKHNAEVSSTFQWEREL